MSGRNYRVLEQSYSTSAIPYGSSWGFRPTSRADQIHRGRNGIDRRFQRVYMDNDDGSFGGKYGSTGSWTETRSRSTDRGLNGWTQESTQRGRTPVRIEEGEDWSMPQENRRMQYVEQRTSTMPERDSSSRQYEYSRKSERPYATQESRISSEGDWEPVRVVRNNPRPNQSEYSTQTRTTTTRRVGGPYPSDNYGSVDMDGQWGYDNDRDRMDSRNYGRTQRGSFPAYTRESSQRSVFEPQQGRTRETYTESGGYPDSPNYGSSYRIESTSSRNNGYGGNAGNNQGSSWESRSMSRREYGQPGTYDAYGDRGTRQGRNERERFESDGWVRNSSASSRQQSRDDMWQDGDMRGAQLGTRSRSQQVSTPYDNDMGQSSRMSRSKSADRGHRGGPSEEMRQLSLTGTRAGNDDKEFLGKLQKELENQRANWQPEIDKLIRSTVAPEESGGVVTSTSFEASKNNYVDTSSGSPIFKAYVDIGEFPPSSVKINFDRYTNKVVVEAGEADAQGGVGKTFTQKIPLPRYADDTRLSARFNNVGILRIEVPLLYHFPEASAEKSKTRAFVYGAQKNPSDGSNTVEIIVTPGAGVTAKDLKTEIAGDSLVVWEVKGREKTMIKKYTLPRTADVDGIRSRIGSDGCLTILIPIT